MIMAVVSYSGTETVMNHLTSPVSDPEEQHDQHWGYVDEEGHISSSTIVMYREGDEWMLASFQGS